ncbi:MAG: trehalose-6-phosphate synthase [Terriglobus roseus]|nr:trehalose-6-phosphate synthase [Terriglobus roseus]
MQVTTPSPTDSVPLAAKISELVDHINATYGSLHYQPVHHYHQTIERDVGPQPFRHVADLVDGGLWQEYFALLSVASLAMITSVRDGMNTTSMEYTICQAGPDGGANPLILSEFTGVRSVERAP